MKDLSDAIQTVVVVLSSRYPKIHVEVMSRSRVICQMPRVSIIMPPAGGKRVRRDDDEIQ